MSREALTFAWTDVTWHGRHVTMTHDGTVVRARAKLGSQVIGVSWHTIWGVSWILYILGIQLDKYSQSNPIFTTFLFNYISTHSHTQLKGLSVRCWSKMLSSSTSMSMIMGMITMIRRVLPWSSTSSSGESPPVRRISDRVIRRYSKLTSMLSFRGGTEIYDDYIIFWLSSYSWPPPLYILASD